MNALRINELVETLNLKVHPEGGFYSETYRSEQTIEGKDQAILTSIYFLITAKSVSNFHQISSDELWYFHEGSPLEIHELGENGHTTTQLGLDFINGQKAFHVVKSKQIFGSCLATNDGYCLVSCGVAPGFLFEDFKLFERQELLKMYPQFNEIISKLTP